jgi:hypothetical protein
MEKFGDGAFGGAYLSESDPVLMLGAVIFRTSKDHEAVVQVKEAAHVLGRHFLILGCFLVAVPALALAGLAQYTLEELVVLELVLDGITVVGAWLLQELLKMAVALSLARTVGHHDSVGVGVMPVLFLLLLLLLP